MWSDEGEPNPSIAAETITRWPGPPQETGASDSPNRRREIEEAIGIVPLTFQFNGIFAGGEPARAAFHGTASTKRAQYGIGARDNLQEVGDATAPDVDIEIDVEADATSPTP